MCIRFSMLGELKCELSYECCKYKRLRHFLSPYVFIKNHFLLILRQEYYMEVVRGFGVFFKC